MMLKQVIRYTNADAIEATWVRYDQLPDVDVPASPALYDKDGNEVQPAVDAHIKPGEVIETVLKCHAYSNAQMDMLRADLGADAAQYESLIAEVEATYVPPAPPSIEERIAVFDAALVAHLDATARERRYDNRVTCVLRAGYPGPFQAEGIAFAAWMDQCNALAYQLLAEVVAGTRPLPDSPQALIDLMPPMVWPS